MHLKNQNFNWKFVNAAIKTVRRINSKFFRLRNFSCLRWFELRVSIQVCIQVLLNEDLLRIFSPSFWLQLNLISLCSTHPARCSYNSTHSWIIFQIRKSGELMHQVWFSLIISLALDGLIGWKHRVMLVLCRTWLTTGMCFGKISHFLHLSIQTFNNNCQRAVIYGERWFFRARLIINRLTVSASIPSSSLTKTRLSITILIEVKWRREQTRSGVTVTW